MFLFVSDAAVMPTTINAAANVVQTIFRIIEAPRYNPIPTSERLSCDQDWLSRVKFCKCGDAIQAME